MKSPAQKFPIILRLLYVLHLASLAPAALTFSFFLGFLFTTIVDQTPLWSMIFRCSTLPNIIAVAFAIIITAWWVIGFSRITLFITDTIGGCVQGSSLTHRLCMSCVIAFVIMLTYCFVPHLRASIVAILAGFSILHLIATAPLLHIVFNASLIALKRESKRHQNKFIYPTNPD